LPVSVRFSLLGPVRAWRGPAELDLGPSQQRALLALLVIRANQLVSIDDIIDFLWGQDPPGSAVNIIHKYIGSIRRLLEPGLQARASGRWLTRRSGAYQLAIDGAMSDLIAFRRTAKDAWSAHLEGRPADALDLYLEVLALRQGLCGEDLDLHGRNRDYFTTVDHEYVIAVARAAPLVPPAQLPADLPTFAGREPELAQFCELLHPSRELPGTVAIFAINGMAGMGKTTFAIRCAHHAAKHFEDGSCT
jgi:Transcriptional regulatory protein, C terminal